MGGGALPALCVSPVTASGARKGESVPGLCARKHRATNSAPESNCKRASECTSEMISEGQHTDPCKTKQAVPTFSGPNGPPFSPAPSHDYRLAPSLDGGDSNAWTFLLVPSARLDRPPAPDPRARTRGAGRMDKGERPVASQAGAVKERQPALQLDATVLDARARLRLALKTP